MKIICDKGCIIVNCENDCTDKDIHAPEEKSKYILRYRRYEAPKFNRKSEEKIIKDTEYE